MTKMLVSCIYVIYVDSARRLFGREMLQGAFVNI